MGNRFYRQGRILSSGTISERRGDLLNYLDDRAVYDEAAMLAERDDDKFPATMKPLLSGVLHALDAMASGLSSEHHAPISVKDDIGNSHLHFDVAKRSFLALIVGKGENSALAMPEATRFVNAAWSLCESPIERAIVPWLVMGWFSPIALAPIPIITDLDDAPDVPLFIVPQFKVRRYRLDFCLSLKVGESRKLLALECDGADFHRDTVADWHRDRELLSMGIRTIRATGSEIQTTPMRVIGRVWGELLAILDAEGVLP